MNNYQATIVFSIDVDPTETNNLFAHYPAIVEIFLKKLADYDKNSYPTFYPPRDPMADPKLHNGTWGPWKAQGSSEHLNFQFRF